MTPADCFGRDCYELLCCAATYYRKRYRCPADALEDVIAFLGWSIKISRLPDGMLALMNGSDNTITMAHDFCRSRRYSPSVGQERHFTLAHEIGHLRLHLQNSCDEMGDLQEQEADQYAAQFLMPYRMIAAHPSVLSPVSPRRLVQDLARSFRVSNEMVTSRLDCLTRAFATKSSY